MKKLLVLALVLGVTGLSSAGLMFTVEDSSITIDGENVFGLLLSAELVVESGDLALDLSGVEFPTGFDLPGKKQNEAGNYAELTISNIFGAPKTGPMVTGISWTGTGVGDLIISAVGGGNTWDGEAQPNGQLFAHHIPEPMTLGLLGLGALFLRRRK
ncbi:MAG: PEP-CTERM sorting domain-containing protein [Sedimentisphaerales bacterium]|nr:PEP-CTERM sorting domain-containing protein [Sedimentisphaerales bacterium]